MSNNFTIGLAHFCTEMIYIFLKQMFHFTYHFTNTMIYTLFGMVRWICKSDHKTFFSALLDLSEKLNFKMCMYIGHHFRVQKTFLFIGS